MGYRRPHHRRAHTRTNADGSKSYVKECDVKGHNYNGNTDKYYSRSHNDEYDVLDGILFLVSISGLILFVLGLILHWSDTLWYLLILVGSLLWLIKRNW